MKDNREITILNVDDNEAGRYATTRQLQRAGYKVLEAGTGAQTWQHLEKERVDIVILDIHLPDVSGLELCARIKEDARFSRLPVVHLTATYVMSIDRLDESKADGYLMQPVEPAALLANIRALLRASDVERRLQHRLDEWQTALDSLSEGIAIVDAKSEVLQSNKPFWAIMGTEDSTGPGALPPELATLVTGTRTSGIDQSQVVELGDRRFTAEARRIRGTHPASTFVVLVLKELE